MPGPFFLWQLFWPVLLDDAVTLLTFSCGRFEQIDAVLVSSLVSGLLVAPFYLRQKKAGSTAVKRSDVFWMILLAASFCLFFNVLLWLLGLTGTRPESQSGAAEGILSWKAALTLALAAPLEEELIFRGMTYRCLRTVSGFWPSALGCALLFGLMHGAAAQGIYAGFLGVLLAAVYERFSCLAAPVLLHGTANLTALLLTSVTALHPGWISPGTAAFLLVGSAAGMGWGLFRIYWK